MIQIPVILNNTLITNLLLGNAQVVGQRGFEYSDLAAGNKDSGTKGRVVLEQLIHGNIVLAAKAVHSLTRFNNMVDIALIPLAQLGHNINSSRPGLGRLSCLSRCGLNLWLNRLRLSSLAQRP